MTTFKLDTSGVVADYREGGMHTLADVGVILPGTPIENINRAERLRTGWTWPDLSPFVQGYIEALFEALGYGDSPERAEARAHRERGWVCNWTGGHCPSGCGSPCTYTIDSTHCGGGKVVQDYNRRPTFSDLAPETLARIMEDCERFGAMCEANLWLIQGNEFWIMRQRGDLTDKDFPPLTLYLSDDGKVRFRD